MTTQPNNPDREQVDDKSLFLSEVALANREAGHGRGNDYQLTLDRAHKCFNPAASTVAHDEARTNLDEGKESSEFVNVVYDRFLLSHTFTDAMFDNWPIAGLSLYILFDHNFPAGDSRSEPAGAEELQRQVRVSYSPARGIEFHCVEPRIGYRVDRYDVTMELGPMGCGGVEIDKATFERILERNSEYFMTDSSLQSTAYYLVQI